MQRRLIPGVMILGLFVGLSENSQHASAAFGDYGFTTQVLTVSGNSQVFPTGASITPQVNAEFPPSDKLNPALGGGYVRADGPNGYSSLFLENTTSGIQIFNYQNKPIFDYGTIYSYSTSATPVNLGTINYQIQVNLFNKSTPGVTDLTPGTAIFQGALTGTQSKSGVSLFNANSGSTTQVVQAGDLLYTLNLSFPGNFESSNVPFGSPATGASRDYTPGFFAVQITNVVPVPEPASFVLMGLGGLTLIGLVSRQRRRSHSS